MRCFSHSAFLAFTLGAVLVGCGAPPSGLNPSMASSESSETRFARAGGDLLYVANGGHVVFFTFPQGKQVGELSLTGSPTSVCSDTAGNVWVPVGVGRFRFRLYEFAHGGTRPIATIDVPKRKTANGCGVDPVTGDLAVPNSYGGTGRGSVLVWAGARSGKPKSYSVGMNPTACAYDDRGNLLVTGWADSDGYFFAELARGANKFTNVTLTKHTFYAGGVQWDGKYFAVAAQEALHAAVYRVRVSASKGQIVQTIRSKEFPLGAWIWVKGSTLVSTQRSKDRRLIGVWNYPAGGTPKESFSGFQYPGGLTVSPGT
jgi:hypothetical protein